MTEERKKEILHGVLDLMAEYHSFDFDVVLPESGVKIHIELEELKNGE